MSITLAPAPTSASAQLQSADVQTLISVLAPLFTLTPPQALSNCTAANLNVRPDGTGMITLRFAAASPVTPPVTSTASPALSTATPLA